MSPRLGKANSDVEVGMGVRITSAVHVTAQALRFEDCAIGIDTSSGGNGLLNLIDSTATNTTALVNSAPATTSAQNSLVLENVIVDSTVPAVGLQCRK